MYRGMMRWEAPLCGPYYFPSFPRVLTFIFLHRIPCCCFGPQGTTFVLAGISVMPKWIWGATKNS